MVSTLLGESLTYSDVIENIGTFTCGVADENGTNAGSIVTIALRLTNSATGEQIDINIVEITL